MSRRVGPGSAVLEVEGLSVDYGGFRALDEVSLGIREGAITAIIGPNGAGKTTCFDAICGYARPSSGRVLVRGRPIRAGDPHAAWKAGIGRTFQRLELFWTLSVREHIELAGHYARRQGGAIPVIDDLLGLFDLREAADDIVAGLPLGICRLVEFARAMATGARILLLDESSSGLDRHETQRLGDTVRAMQSASGLTILLIEHDMEFVMSLAEYIFVLDFGTLIAEGTPDEIRRSELVHRVYLGGDAGRSLAGSGVAPG